MWGREQSFGMYVRLLAVPFVLSLIDAGVTLSYQPEGYWEGDRSVVIEGNPIVWLVLRIHPVLLVPGYVGWYGLFWWLIFRTPAWIGLRLCAFLILGHQVAIAGWLVRFHEHGWWWTAALWCVFLPLGAWALWPYRGQWEGKVPLRKMA